MRLVFAPLRGFVWACAVILAASVASAAAPPLISADPAPGGLAPSSLPGAVRSRAVALDLALLDALAFGSKSDLGLSPFDDAPFDATVERRVIRGPQSYTIAGTIARRPFASFTIVREQDAVVGLVLDQGKSSYAIEPVAPGLQRAVELDLAAQPPCAMKDSPPKPPTIVPTRDAAPVKSCIPTYPDGEDGTIIDVMMLYTPGVTAELGSVAAVDALINLAIDNTNTAFTNSAVGVQFRLVHTEQVIYTDTANLGTDLNRLSTSGDGFLDNVQALRDTHRADLVGLLVTDGGTSCGIGYLLSNLFSTTGPFAYSVTAYGCVFGHTFAHEAGHNMGCNHDRPNSGGGQLFNYSYGYSFVGQSSNTWGTIMSYVGSRRLHYSNPNVLYDGVPTGIAPPASNSADNAQTISLSHEFISNYRRSLDDEYFTITPDDDFLASGPAGGPFSPSCEQYTLVNSGPTPISWSVAGGQPWLDISPTTGTLAASGGSQIVDVCIDSSATSMTAGAYATTLTFDSGGQGISRRRKATLRIEGVASLPFDDSFDTAAEPGSPWRVSGTNEWCIGSDATGGNPEGPQSILLHEDGLVAGSSLAELTLSVNLAGRQRVRMHFTAKLGNFETIDGAPPPSYTTSPNYDGIAVSEDGVTWHVIHRFPGISTYWTFFEVDLDDAIAAAGINYSSDFKIKFTQFGPSRAPSYGLYLDNLSVFEAPNVTRSWLDYD